jgi:triosephosphate isomerase
MRKPLVVGNWKLHGTRSGAVDLAQRIAAKVDDRGAADIGVCPTFVHLAAVAQCLAGSPVGVGSQDVSDRSSGAYTGEVGAPMLAELGCRYAIVGHSERRARHGETDEGVAAKAKAAIDAGLVPIVCVGESLAERDAGRANEIVIGQLEAVLALGAHALVGSVVAYEPVWAIGTGRTATPEQAQTMHAALRERVAGADARLAERTRIVYGGSVKAANAERLFEQSDIDGALVGGASLDADQFGAICRAAGN